MIEILLKDFTYRVKPSSLSEKELSIRSNIPYLCRDPRTPEAKRWMKAFKFYNERVKPNLGMGCSPCYKKVFEFCLANREEFESLFDQQEESSDEIVFETPPWEKQIHII